MKKTNKLLTLFYGFDQAFVKAMRYPMYKYFILLLGLPVTVFILIRFLFNKKNSYEHIHRQQIISSLEQEDYYEKIRSIEKKRLLRKYEFFNETIHNDKFDLELKKLTDHTYQNEIERRVREKMDNLEEKPNSIATTFVHLYQSKWFRVSSYIFGFFMYAGLFIFKNPYLKYIFERLVMLLFVIFGVTLVVFTILYVSPMDPARNILGELATEEQVRDWKELYGMNDSYFVQAFRAMKNVVTFDFGNSFVGNEPVVESLMRKFPITLKVTIASLIISVLIAVPAGIISAIKQYSTFDFSAMTLALIGISIPNFWLGLMLILVFSVNLGWLNVIYDNAEMKSLIMPAIVLGTALAASVARMTRSSMLEVIKSDYITTARAKGLKEKDVILGHALRNAIIPIITIIGLQFGGMLGGSAVTERVFTIPGIGSYIVSKQMIPDIPVVLAGVVYIAIIISIANLMVDILYAFFDPRIKAKLKKY